MKGQYICVGTIRITDIEYKKLRRKKVVYKMIRKQWWKIERKNGEDKYQLQIQRLKAKFKAKIKKIEEAHNAHK